MQTISNTKSELQELNIRLRNYIQKVKDMEIEKKSSEDIFKRYKEEMENELINIKKDYTNKIDMSDRIIETQSKELNQARSIETQHYNEILKLKEQLNELNDIKVVAEQLSKDLRHEKEVTMTYDDNLKRQTSALRTIQTKLQLVEDEKNIMRTKLKSTEKTLADIQDKYLKLKEGNDQYNISLRKELNNQYEEDFKKREQYLKDIYEKELLELRKNSEEQITQLRNQLLNTLKEKDTLKDEVEELLSDKRKNAEKLNHLEMISKSKNDMLRSEKQKSSAKINSLNKIIQEKTNIIEKHKKNATELKDTNLALESEISSFKNILESEENRVGIRNNFESKVLYPSSPNIENIGANKKISPPRSHEKSTKGRRTTIQFPLFPSLNSTGNNKLESPNKRKHSTASVSPLIRRNSTENTRIPSPLNSPKDSAIFTISNVDLKDNVITIRNETNESIDMTGWILGLNTGRKIVTFPTNYYAPPKDTITVRCLERESLSLHENNLSTNTFYGKAFTYSVDQNTVILVDEKMFIVAKRNVIGNPSNIEGERNNIYKKRKFSSYDCINDEISPDKVSNSNNKCNIM